MMKAPGVLALVATLLAGAPVASRAQDFYAGKTIHFYIGYSPGGG